LLGRDAAQGGVPALPEADRRDRGCPARRRAARPRRGGATAGRLLAVAGADGTRGRDARLDPQDDERRGAARQGHLRAVTAAESPRRRDSPRLRGPPRRPRKGAPQGDLLARPAPVARERGVPAHPVREARGARPQGEGDLLALADARRREHALDDGPGAERARGHRDAQEGAVLGGPVRRQPRSARGAVRPRAESGDEGAARLRLLAAARACTASPPGTTTTTTATAPARRAPRGSRWPCAAGRSRGYGSSWAARSAPRAAPT